MSDTLPSTTRWRAWRCRARHARQRLGHSIQWRLVLLFLGLSAAMALIFVLGAQRAFAVGWRDAARPLVSDYLDHLAHEVTGGGPTPELARAQALVERLPITLRIDGPRLHWSSRDGLSAGGDDAGLRGDGVPRLLSRQTADGHTLTFGINHDVFERRAHHLWVTLATLLLLTLAAWGYVRRLLRPLDAIGAGAQRFGRGDFSQPIPVRHAHRPDELGQLAQTINTMGEDIRQMLDAKRALLLAISHELRSPLTRARLNAELLPEDGSTADPRAALLRDLQEMGTLISDLLESERLAGRHAALQREPTDVPALARGVLAELAPRHPAAARVRLSVDPGLPPCSVDPARLRLLLRNLLDNALRHGADAAAPPELHLGHGPHGLTLALRDHGPGVPEDQLARLAEPFHRPDAARTRHAGGVGLGLYLCRLVAQAHGGQLSLSNARPGPGLQVQVQLPDAGTPSN